MAAVVASLDGTVGRFATRVDLQPRMKDRQSEEIIVHLKDMVGDGWGLMGMGLLGGVGMMHRMLCLCLCVVSAA